VQARMSSTRLPGKVMMPLAGSPLLERVVSRVRAARTRLEVVVATTTEPEDAEIRSLCRWLNVPCVSGHPTDLLARHLQAARQMEADVVAKIPSDCPLIDPEVIDRVLGAFLADPERYDYVSNLHPGTWPDGNDVEVMPIAALERAGREAQKPHEREHTTPFLWDQPERFRIGNVEWEGGLDLSMSHRLTVDYPEDLELVQAIYDGLCLTHGPHFGTRDILGFLKTRPDVFALNVRYAGVNWYRHHLEELRTVGAGDTRQPGAAA